MPTCSIFDNITINNPQFIEMYVDHMDRKDGKSSIKPKDPSIKIATPEDVERLWKLRRERREAGK